MATYVNTIPQNLAAITVVTLPELLAVLPDQIPYNINVWISGKMAKYGIATQTLIFVGELDDEPTSEMKMYFSDLCAPLPLEATLSEGWKKMDETLMRLYNNGKLIIDRVTMCYTEPVSATKTPPVITHEEILRKLESEIIWKYDLYLTGSLVAIGWSANDVDIMYFDEATTNEEVGQMKRYFASLFGCKVDIGKNLMPNREPIYLYKIYEKGVLCLL